MRGWTVAAIFAAIALVVHRDLHHTTPAGPADTPPGWVSPTTVCQPAVGCVSRVPGR